jgi:hypothetical protein
MVFIPFMGAAIAMEKPAKNAYEDALIAFGGPVLGTAGAMITSYAAVSMDSQLLYALADFGYMINLFNLLPIGMMDGGRIGNAISPYFGVAGLAAGGTLIYMKAIYNPIFYLIMLTGAYSTASRFFGWDKPGEGEEGYGEGDGKRKDYYNIGGGKQVGLCVGYFGLIGVLLSGMAANAVYKKPPKQLQYEKDHPEEMPSADPWKVQEDEYFEEMFGKSNSSDHDDGDGDYPFNERRK